MLSSSSRFPLERTTATQSYDVLLANGCELREACRALGGAERPADFGGEQPGLLLREVLQPLNSLPSHAIGAASPVRRRS
jgi:hypothetical protein